MRAYDKSPDGWLRCKDSTLKWLLLSSNVRWEGERFPTYMLFYP